MRTKWLRIAYLMCSNVFCVTCQLNFFGNPFPTFGRSRSNDDSFALTCVPTRNTLNDFSFAREFRLARRSNINVAFQDIVSLHYDERDTEVIEWFDREVQQRARIEGELGSPDNSRFVLRIEDVDCTDQAEYKCTYFDDAFPEPIIRQRRIAVFYDSIEILPILATFVSINTTIEYRHLALANILQLGEFQTEHTLPVGTTGIFNCSTSETFPPNNLKWCIMRPIDTELRSFNGMSVQLIRGGVSRQRECLFARTSILAYSITESDNGTRLTCTAGNSCSSTNGIQNSIVLNTVLNGSVQIVPGEESAVNSQETISVTILLAVGVVICIIGITSISLAVFTHMKTRKLKTAYEDKKIRERYLTVSTDNVNRGISNHMYDEMKNSTGPIGIDMRNYDYVNDSSLYAEVK